MILDKWISVSLAPPGSRHHSGIKHAGVTEGRMPVKDKGGASGGGVQSSGGDAAPM